MEYQIRYESAFAVDQFGFVRKGKIKINGEVVELAGYKHWSALARLGVFLAITILPLALFGVGVGFLLALVIIHYFCASPASLKFNKSDITEVRRSTRKISFRARDPLKQGGKLKKSLFNATSEEEAIAIEKALLGSTASNMA